MLNHSRAYDRTVAIDRRMCYDTMRNVVSRTPWAPYVFEEELPGDLNGIYDEDSRIVVIDPRLNERQKRCTLTHELLHWTRGDICDATSYTDKAERHARRETARFLIDLPDYIRSESIYEGETFSMAVDLNVTVSVLEDYRTLLLNGMPAGVVPAGIGWRP